MHCTMIISSSSPIKSHSRHHHFHIHIIIIITLESTKAADFYSASISLQQSNTTFLYNSVTLPIAHSHTYTHDVLSVHICMHTHVHVDHISKSKLSSSVTTEHQTTSKLGKTSLISKMIITFTLWCVRINAISS